MNKRIKELAEQAGAFIIEPEHAKIGEVSEVSFNKYSDLEKFAELIIRECAAFKEELSQFDSSTAYGDGYEQGLKDVTETFLEHFGVEE